MLDEKDLQMLQSLFEQSEARMSTKIEESEARMSAKIEESEARMSTKIEESEARMTTRIDSVESKIMGYIESAVMPKFDILADGHKLLTETLAPKSRVEELEEEIAFLKPLVMSMLTDIDKLKKAQ